MEIITLPRPRNDDIGGEADVFWLPGDQAISAVDQVGFLTRLVTERWGRPVGRFFMLK